MSIGRTDCGVDPRVRDDGVWLTDEEAAVISMLACVELGRAFQVRVERLDDEGGRMHLVLSAEPHAKAYRMFVISMAEQGVRVTYERSAPPLSSPGAGPTS